MNRRNQALLPLCAALAAIAGAPGAGADEVSELRQQLEAAKRAIQQMEGRIQQLEQRPAAPTSQAIPPSAAATIPPSTAPIPAKKSDRSFEVYGFAQVDYVQDFNRVNPAWDDTLRPSRIPTSEGQFGDDGQAILSVRQSRLGVQGKLPVGGQELFTKFEIDMFGVGGDEGQTTIRLRHAYGEWGQILAGQTHSLFMDIDLFPNTIDYWGPSGMVFLRNPQIRWTPLKGDNSFAIAIEKPGNDIDESDPRTIDPTYPFGGGSLQSDEEYPDITAQARMSRDWGHLQLGGILRQLGYETVGGPAGNNTPDGQETGWGLDLSSNIKFGADTLRLGVVYGEGIASYMNDGGVDLAVDGVNRVEPVPLLGIVAYYDHYWNEQWSTAIGYSSTEVDNQDLQSGDAFEKGEYASVNLLYAPHQRVLMGAEYLWGKRTDNDGSSGEDNRLQFSVKYGFSSLDF